LQKNADDGSMYCMLRTIFQQTETDPFIPPGRNDQQLVKAGCVI